VRFVFLPHPFSPPLRFVVAMTVRWPVIGLDWQTIHRPRLSRFAALSYTFPIYRHLPATLWIGQQVLT
jgi:hypothetical protein